MFHQIVHDSNSLHGRFDVVVHLSDEYARGTIRVSFGKQNTLDEATTIANAIIKILNSRTV